MSYEVCFKFILCRIDRAKNSLTRDRQTQIAAP